MARQHVRVEGCLDIPADQAKHCQQRRCRAIADQQQQIQQQFVVGYGQHKQHAAEQSNTGIPEVSNKVFQESENNQLRNRMPIQNGKISCGAGPNRQP